MAALTQDVNMSVVGPAVYAPFTVNVADIYYQGSIVYIDTAGGSQVVPASGDITIGISTKQQNVGTSDVVEVLVSGLVWMPVGSGITAADEGDWCVNDISASQTDNPADHVAGLDITAAGGDCILGRILRVTSTQMLVAITPGVTGSLYVATAGWGG